MDTFTTDELVRLCDDHGLVFPRALLGQVVTALRVGKHVVLTGPPGTGKTSLAYLAGELGRRALWCAGALGVTASQEWDTNLTIGRYLVSPEGTVFHAGVFVEAIESAHWLVIDELNRANLDQAFGPFFTVLAGQSVTLPFKRTGHELPIALVPPEGRLPEGAEALRIPATWRIVATMNAFDKDLLYRLSHALMRRFAFIQVTNLSDEEIAEILEPEARFITALLPVREIIDLGPGVFLDAAVYAAERRKDPTVSESRVLYEAFTSFLAPQLDGLTAGEATTLMARVRESFDEPELVGLERTLAGLLGNRSPAAALTD